MSSIITVIGSMNMDLVTVTPRVPTGGETLAASSFHTGSGGKGANQAVAVCRQSKANPHNPANAGATDDVVVKMIAAVGADEFGPTLVSSLQHDGIDTTGVRVATDQRTGVAVILVEESSGQNRILFNAGANATLLPEHFSGPASLGTPVPDLLVLQLETPLDTVKQIMQTALEAGVPVLLNPAPAVRLPDHMFRGLRHLILNETEAAILSGVDPETFEEDADKVDWDAVADGFLQKGVENLVITLGGKGSYSISAAGRAAGQKGVRVGVEPGVKVVDTTAAGDTFVGAYAVAAVRAAKMGQWDIGSAVKIATKAAARTVEKQGAQSAIPWADEIDVVRS